MPPHHHLRSPAWQTHEFARDYLQCWAIYSLSLPTSLSQNHTLGPVLGSWCGVQNRASTSQDLDKNELHPCPYQKRWGSLRTLSARGKTGLVLLQCGPQPLCIKQLHGNLCGMLFLWLEFGELCSLHFTPPPPVLWGFGLLLLSSPLFWCFWSLERDLWSIPFVLCVKG